jgi:hypothetical protein
MRKLLYFLLSLAFSAALLLLFVVIHETGHTLAARLLGDPDSTFYLVRIDENSACLGCNITDHNKLTPLGNLWVSLAGLASTSLTGLGLMALAALLPLSLRVRRWALGTGLAYVLLDSIVQGLQGLLYDIEAHSWPTSVDLMDVLLLLRGFTGLGQDMMKPVMFVLLCLYLAGAVLLFRRVSRDIRSVRSHPG